MPVPSGNSIAGAKSPPTAARVPGATRGDEAELTAWLAAEVAPTEMSDERLWEAALLRRSERRQPRLRGIEGKPLRHGDAAPDRR